jgi:hypothetical protein
MLIIWHQRTDQADAEIEAIRAAYKQRFEVMLVDSTSCVSF